MFAEEYWIFFLTVTGYFFISIRDDQLYIFMVAKTETEHFKGGGPRGVMVKAMDCGIVVGESALQSRYYIHFRANTLGKGMNPLILPAMG